MALQTLLLPRLSFELLCYSTLVYSFTRAYTFVCVCPVRVAVHVFPFGFGIFCVRARLFR